MIDDTHCKRAEIGASVAARLERIRKREDG